MSGDIKNRFNFKLIWDSTTRMETIDNSPLIIIGMSYNSNQYYAACVDPYTKKNYTLQANISITNKFDATFAEIIDEEEKFAVDDFFLKSGVFEYYYKGSNWDFQVKPVHLKGNTQTDKNGKRKVYEPHGQIVYPRCLARFLNKVGV